MKACPAMIPCAVRSVCNPAHRSESVFELAVIGLDRIVGVPLELGIPASAYAAFSVAILTAVAAVFIGVDVLIFLRRGDDPAALLVSGSLVVFGVEWPNTITAHGGALGALAAAYTVASIVGFLGLVFLFPDARFVPGWTRWPFLVLVLGAILAEGGIVDLETLLGP